MSFRTTLLLLFSNALIVALFLGLTYYAIRVNATRNAATVEALDARISQVIIQTLKTVREDVGLLSSAPAGPNDGEKEEKKVPVLEGVESLSIIGDDFYLDGRRFSAGQCVYPWGVCIAVLPTSVVFVGMDGGTTIVCRNGRGSNGADNLQAAPGNSRADKDSKPAAPLSV